MPNASESRLRMLGRWLPGRADTDVYVPAWCDLHVEHLGRLAHAGSSTRRSLERGRFTLASLALWADCWRLVVLHPSDLLGGRRSPLPPRSGASMRADLRYVIRALAREPMFSAFVVATLALGIGANAAMFGVVDRLLVQGPAHLTDPGRIRRVYIRYPSEGARARGYQTFGYVTYDLLRRGARSFSAVGAYSINPDNLTFGEGTNAALLTVGAGTADLFPLLGVRAALGRFFSPDEDAPASPQHVVVLGDGLWRRAFGADRGVVGRTVKLGGEPYTIIGVAPPGFTGPELASVDVWLPMSLRSRGVNPNWPTSWTTQWLRIVGRLKPGVTPSQAAADVTAAWRHGYTGRSKEEAAAELFTAPLLSDATGKETAEITVSRWLVGVAVIVLLIACSNVINLLLARAARRRREMAVRVALGAARARLVRLLLAESLLLATVGGLAGLAVAWFTGRLIRTTLLPNVEWPSSPVDARVLLVSLGITLVVGVAVGLVPALRASRPDLTPSLKAGSRQGGAPHARLRSILTIGQAALSILLLFGAGLFVKSLAKVRSLDLGIEPERALVVSLRWPATGVLDKQARLHERGRRIREYANALDRVRHLPGVGHASLAVGLPFNSSFSQYLRVPGWDSIPRLAGNGPYVSAVTSDYFETIGTKILSGRGFTTADREGSEPVAIVDRTMAHTLWPRGEPIGSCLFTSDDKDSLTVCARVVGVVADSRRFRLREEPAMHYYIPFGQERGFGGVNLLVRPVGPPSAIMPALRATIAAVDPTVTYVDVETLQQSIDPQIRPWRLGATLFGLMGLLALLVAAVGLYSVMSYLIAQRTHEIGVRMALGAGAVTILGLVLRQGMGMAAAGVAVGTSVALVAGRFLQPLLFETSPRDPVVLAGVGTVMLAVALLASVVPANRAQRVDPIEALRYE